MKKALTLALLGALAVSPALARGGAEQRSEIQGGQQSQAGQTSQQRLSLDQDTVRQLQEQLQSQGYDVGEVDGVLGPNTRQALTDFQRDQNLQASGQPDEQTMAALGIEPGASQQAEIPETQQQQRDQGQEMEDQQQQSR